MHILVVDPFLGGSHKQWAEAWQAHSRHSVDIVGLPGKFWKWRLIGSAPVLVEAMLKHPRPDVLIYSSMANAAVISGLLPLEWQSIPSAMYMHENQLLYTAYLKSDQRPKRSPELEIINILSCLAVDQIWFNSTFHRKSFLAAIPEFLSRFPDYTWVDKVDEIEQKALLLYVGIEAPEPNALSGSFSQATTHTPIILWNHRWDFDKDPAAFFNLLIRLSDRGLPFRLIATGEMTTYDPKFITDVRRRLSQHIVHWGYVEDKKTYYQYLHQADVLPVTSRQEFFGISVVEAIARGVFPLLPHRLAYPEHIPEAFHEAHLYKGMKELEAKLAVYLQRPQSLPAEIEAHISRYYWSNIRSAYDARVDSLAGF
jgi:glycosyltransferase involved in cell wall biosynthesis